MNKNNKRYSPFSRIKAVVYDIDYDVDENENEQIKTLLPPKITFEYMAKELFNEGILSEDEEIGIDWILNEDKLTELISDYITDDTGFCHNGFKFRYSIIP